MQWEGREGSEMRRPQSKSLSAPESGWDGEVMIIYGPFDAKRLNGNDEKKGLLRPDFFPPSKMKFRTEIEEFCVVRRGVITRQRLTSRRSLCILITPLSVEQSSTRERVALLTCGDKVETYMLASRVETLIRIPVFSLPSTH